MERRGRQKVERGPVSDYVADNVLELRKVRGLSQQELSDRLRELGRPMVPSALSKIESCDRGVDVDDLMALAVALGVNPSRLLLVPYAGERDVSITPAKSVPSWAAWQWVDGFAPLPEHSEADGYSTDAEIEDFHLHSRPSEFRQEQRHPLMLAANRLVASLRRVIRHAARPRDVGQDQSGNLGLEMSLPFARRHLQGVAGELDAIEEEARDRGER